MPKPVLSDSLFNANDVATAILNSAELSVTNQDFAVVDRTADFVIQSGWSNAGSKMFSFNGFMFVMFYCTHAGTPSTTDTIFQNTNSSTRPSDTYFANLIGSEGDLANNLRFDSSGAVFLSNPVNTGVSTYYASANAWYRF